MLRMTWLIYSVWNVDYEGFNYSSIFDPYRIVGRLTVLSVECLFKVNIIGIFVIKFIIIEVEMKCSVNIENVLKISRGTNKT